MMGGLLRLAARAEQLAEAHATVGEARVLIEAVSPSRPAMDALLGLWHAGCDAERRA